MIGIQEIILISIPLFFIILIWLLFFKGNQRQQQQQQQQIVIQNDYQRNRRICPKCGWQNDKDTKFCSDCGFKFS